MQGAACRQPVLHHDPEHKSSAATGLRCRAPDPSSARDQKHARSGDAPAKATRTTTCASAM
eukprot:15220937-Alexandrium_andersonii.AAC.1